MLFKNHFFSLVLIGIACASTQVHASQFTSLSKCREHFQTSVQSGSRDIAAMDAWCKGQMNELDFCTESALLKSMMSNSYSAAQIPQVRSGFENQCRRDIAARAAGANTVAGTPNAGSGTAGAAFDANGVPQPPTPPANTNCASVSADQQQSCQAKLQNYQAQLQTYQRNLQAYNQRQEQARQQQLAAQQAQRQQQQANNMQAMQMMVGVGSQMAQQYGQGGGGGAQSYVSDLKVPEGYVISTPTGNGATPTIKAVGPNASPTAAAEASSSAIPAAQTLGKEANEAASALGGSQGAQNAAKGVTEQPFDPEKAEVPKTDMTIQAEEKKKKLEGVLKEGENVIEVVRQKVQGQTVALNNYARAAQETNQQSSQYLTEKDPCVKEAERANKLCIEGNSPGAKATKAFVDYSGPILGAMSSAVNACSSTKKVMNFAQIGLTVAKGVCVASKVSCDTKCAKSFKNLETMTKYIEAEKTALEQDNTVGQQECRTNATLASQKVPPAGQAAEFNRVANLCISDLNTKLGKAQAYYNKIVAWAQDEKQVKGGTTNEMIANCQAKGRDIALMATNILTLAMSKMSAQKCEKQLSTAGAGGGGSPQNVSTAEYCSTPETKSSDFCRCQTNPSAEGCAGALAGGGPGGNLPEDKKGIALNLQKGPSGFAGSTGGGKPGSSGVTVGAGGGGAGVAVGAAQLKSGNGITYGNPNYGGGNEGGAAAGGGGSAGDAAASAAAAPEDKKWSFGAFASSGSGSGGGSRGYSGSGSSGSMSPEQQEAIERKIASDRYAAEVTTSTGPNNFDKIKQAVRSIGDTLEPNQ